MQAQLGAMDTQIVALGLAISGSSNVPARTNIKCGRDSASLNICVPHFGQKRRCMALPLSAVSGKSVSAPSTVSALVGKQTFTVPLPAARY
jgi:hypothetical protein